MMKTVDGWEKVREGAAIREEKDDGKSKWSNEILKKIEWSGPNMVRDGITITMDEFGTGRRCGCAQELDN